MRIMCIGDVVGSVGCRFLRDRLPSVKRFNGVDLVICNGENSADGNGMTAVSAHYLFDSGVDAITLGNHAFRRQEVYGMLDENPFIVRPANFPDRVPGKGIINLDMGRRIVTIINLMGNMGMDDGLENAFDCADRLLEQAESKIILLDFHAVQTSDAQVLPNGTGYITDLGMTGTIHSVLGVKTDIIINRFRTKLPARFELADGACRLEAALFEIDDKNGKCLNAESMRIE